MRTKHTLKKLWLILAVMFILPVSAQTRLQQQIAAITAITQTEALESTEFSEKYLTRFTQPLDHHHPEKGTFSQRVYVSHVGFDRPVVLVTEGYSAGWASVKSYREELSKLFNTNMIFVEHRYFEESTPNPKDWQYLTAENSAYDLHAVREAFRSIYPGKWIATGISKGGQTATLYRAFFPDDVDISVPYVAPLCYGVEDGRHEPFIDRIGTPAERRLIRTFQLEVLKRKSTLLPAFEQYCRKKNYQFRASMPEILDYCILEYPFALWQWGTDRNTIPAATESDDVLLKHLLQISEPGYFSCDQPNTSFFVQAARELGYYGYDTRPFRSYLSIRSAEGYLHRLMLPAELQDMKFDKTLSRKIKKYLKREDPRIIFLYGSDDPWTAAGVTWLKDKQNLHVYVQPGGSHLTRISTLPAPMQQEVIDLITKWLNE